MAWELDPRDQKKIPLRSKENHNQRPKQKARPRRQGKATNRKLKKKKKNKRTRRPNQNQNQTNEPPMECSRASFLQNSATENQTGLECHRGWSCLSSFLIGISPAKPTQAKSARPGHFIPFPVGK